MSLDRVAERIERVSTDRSNSVQPDGGLNGGAGDNFHTRVRLINAAQHGNIDGSGTCGHNGEGEVAAGIGGDRLRASAQTANLHRDQRSSRWIDAIRLQHLSL